MLLRLINLPGQHKIRMQHIVNFKFTLSRRSVLFSRESPFFCNRKRKNTQMLPEINLRRVHTFKHHFFGRPMEQQNPGIRSLIRRQRFISTHIFMRHLMHPLTVLLYINAHFLTGFTDNHRYIPTRMRNTDRCRFIFQLRLPAGIVSNFLFLSQQSEQQHTNRQPFQTAMFS